MSSRRDLERELASVVFVDLCRGRGPAHERARATAKRLADVVQQLGWTPPPSATGCPHCGEESHGFACKGLLRGASLSPGNVS